MTTSHRSYYWGTLLGVPVKKRSFCASAPTWSLPTAGASRQGTGGVVVQYSGNPKYIVGSNSGGNIAYNYSTDGVNFSAGTVAATVTSGPSNIIYTGGYFYQKINALQSARSVDGENWSIITHSSFSCTTIRDLGGRLFYTSGSNIYYSDNTGTSQTAVALAGTHYDIAAIGSIITVGSLTNAYYSTTNGASYSACTVSAQITSGGIKQIATDGDIALGLDVTSTNYLHYTLDGQTWASKATLPATSPWLSLLYAYNKFWLFGNGNNFYSSSDDGDTWTLEGSTPTDVGGGARYYLTTDDKGHWLVHPVSGTARTTTNVGICS